MNSATTTIAPEERSRLVRRNTILLACCQGLAAITFPVLLIVGSVAIVEITGRDSSAGVMNGVYFLSAAGGAFLFGRAMDRFGRRAGLLASYLLLSAAGGVCALGAAAGSFPILLAGAVVFGAGFSGANLARGAVADMYEPAHRGRAVGIVLAVSTIGAVGSPFLIAAVRAWAEGTEFDAEVLPWAIVPVVGVAAFGCALALRPDPRDLAVVAATADPAPGARSPSQLLAIPMFRTAVVAAAIGQMAMVAVMGVTPVALHHHDTSTTVISTVISLHIAGMWALSPFIGWGLDRFGRKPGLLAGGAVSIAGCLLAATDSGAGLVATGLFAIGLGWSATFLGATALISDLTEPSERGAALGFNDLLVSVSSAIAGFAGGFVFEGAGFRVLGVAVASLVLVVMLAVLRAREPAPAVAGER
ncbi:MAG TPA: MFS transporter [Actinomycetota bacterium]|nr:MFS transporter [Actinomycetota bacterium]